MNNTNASDVTSSPPEDTLATECLEFVPVPSKFINYASLPMLVLTIVLSFSVQRKRLWPGSCSGRPGLLIPMDLIRGTTSRLALSAAFAILTSKLMRLLLEGDEYWHFPSMDDPALAEKLSFLSILVKIFNSVQLSLCFYPLFVCIIHQNYILLNILGYLTMIPWFYYTVRIIYDCSLSPDSSTKDLVILLVKEFPEFIAYTYLIWFFTKRLFVNISRKRQCCKCKHGDFILSPKDTTREPVYLVYVRGMLQRKDRKMVGMLANVKESLTYRKIPGLRSSPRILITLTVSSLAVYSLTWTLFGFVNFLEQFFRTQLNALREGLGLDPEALIGQELIEDYIMASVYGAYACSFGALLCELICLWRVYVNYRQSVRLLLRGDKSLYKEIIISPPDRMVYASKYPGFQIACTVYGYAVTFLLLFIVLVVIFTYLLVLPLKWHFSSLVWELIKANWQTIVISFLIYYSQVIFAKFVFFDRETGMYDNHRLFSVSDYFLFFFNALLSLFTSLKRIVLSAVFGIVYLSRLDQCGMMHGFEKFDNGHKAFIAMLHVEVTQNNPIMLSFIELLRRGAVQHREASPKTAEIPLGVVEGGKLTTIEAAKGSGTFYSDPKSRRHRWAVNQWQKALTLVNNPSLVMDTLSKNALIYLTTEA